MPSEATEPLYLDLVLVANVYLCCFVFPRTGLSNIRAHGHLTVYIVQAGGHHYIRHAHDRNKNVVINQLRAAEAALAGLTSVAGL